MTSRGQGVLLVLGAALLWSTGGLGIKEVAEPPLKVAFYRSAFAAAALFLILRPRVRRWNPPFLAALATYAACLITFVVATKWTTAANAIFIQYAGVIWVLLLSPLVVGEPLRARDAAAVAVAFAGMALFFVGRLGPGGRGDLVALASSFFWAGLILSLKREKEGGAEAAVAWGNVVAVLALLPFVASDLSLSPRSAAILAFLGVFQLAFAYILFVKGLKLVSATQASLIGMAEPVCNPIWVFLVMGERPGVYALAGGAIVLSAIAWRTVVASPVEPLPPPD
ncbi:MAG TPA: DMT family transporter [Thermoanaerobaculia bacterium]|nr:DMT family transporter [Thermoanaerobaculia bacterium]